MKSKTSIIICGDICPTNDTKHFFENNDVKGLFNDTLPILKQADILIGNMEFVLADDCNEAIKTGPILKGRSSFINMFKEVGFTVLGLANNHIKDCGTKGVLSSLQTCQENDILTVGAGSNEKEAKKPVIIEKNGWKIGIMAFAEHEFNAAYKNESGANLLDLYYDFEQIKELRRQVDYVIILYHGGIEYYEYPSPLLQKKCRKMIDSGANYVICQHSHIIGTEETYKQGKVLYGQGNTVFGYQKNNDLWNQGLLVKIVLDDIELINKIDYIPIKTITNSSVVLQNRSEVATLFSKMNTREKYIKQEAFVSNSWNFFCENKKSLYFPLLLGKGRIFNKLNRILNNKLITLFYSRKHLRIVKNIMRCESHREVITTILENH